MEYCSQLKRLLQFINKKKLLSERISIDCCNNFQKNFTRKSSLLLSEFWQIKKTFKKML